MLMDAGADANKRDQRGRVHVFVLHELLFAVEGPSDSDHMLYV